MNLTPGKVEELLQQLAAASAASQCVEHVNLSALNGVLVHTPEDLTITVQTGITLAALQSHLSKRGQWLPIDPPKPQTLSMADILHQNLSGPRRFGFGTIRDHLLGLSVALADGRLIHNGGKVVKNVAGYDLCKLFVGSQATLGIIVEATFKLLPLPERELFLAWRSTDLSGAIQQVENILAMPITPVALDLHNLTNRALTLVVALAGTEEDVAFQEAQLKPAGFEPLPSLTHQDFLEPDSLQRHSVLPSRLADLLSSLREVPFVARAGNGIVYAQGGPAPAATPRPVELERRVKNLFDPKNILAAPSW